MMDYDLFVNTLDQIKDTECEEIYLEGSGEPTMNKRLPDFVKAGTDRGFKMSFITNGFWFKGDLMKRTVDAGMHFARFSVTGYTPELYKENMSKDAFYEVRENAENAVRYIGDGPASIGSYHLILDNSDSESFQVEQYRKNWIQESELVFGVCTTGLANTKTSSGESTKVKSVRVADHFLQT